MEQPPCACSVTIARALAFCQNNKTACRVLNHNPYVVTLKKGMKLARILGLDSVAAITQCTVTGAVDPLLTPPGAVSRTELDEFHQTYGFRLCLDLDEEKRYQALEMLYRYKSVFARDLSEINNVRRKR